MHKFEGKGRELEGHQVIHFGGFRLDTVNEILWRGSKKVHLRPKTLALLRYLCESSGRLVTNKELMANLWHGSHVGNYVLKSAIVEIRKALGDDVNEPRFVETRRRFCAHPARMPATCLPSWTRSSSSGFVPRMGWSRLELSRCQEPGNSSAGRPFGLPGW